MSSSMSDTSSSVPTVRDTKERDSLGEKSETTIPSKLKEDIESSPVSSSNDLEKLDDSKFLKGKELFLVFVGMLLSIFLVALDQTIVSPALPVIASKFNALSQIGWIASAYFLTQASFMMLFGTMLNIFDRKWVFILAITLFELGSLFCAVAGDVNFLIFGRAVAGLGGSGIFISCLSIISEVTRLEQRPMFFGAFGGVFAVSSIVGPLLGGVFTSKATWRWCFYINLPVGAITIGCILLIIKSTPVLPLEPEVVSLTRKRFGFILNKLGKCGEDPSSFIFRILSLDLGGVVLMLGVVTTLLLPLQWGGNQHPWNSPLVIALFCVFGVMVCILTAYEHFLAGPNRILPLNFFKNPTQVGCCLMSFFTFFGMMLFIYFLPLQYQAVMNHSAERSGIDILPLMLGVVLFSGISGGIITKTGHYWTVLLIGPMILAIGGGLFFTVTSTTSNGALIGYQFLVSAGIGVVMQNLIIAIQANVASERDIPLATSLVTFAQLIGASVGVAIATSVFDNELGKFLKIYAPNAPLDTVKNSVLSIYTLPADEIAGVVKAYVKALDYVYIIAVGLGAGASLAVLLIKNVNIKGRGTAATPHMA